MPYDAAAYRQKLLEYLRAAYVAQGKDPSLADKQLANSSGGGGSGGGGTGAAVAGTVGSIAVQQGARYLGKKGAKALADYWNRKNTIPADYATDTSQAQWNTGANQANQVSGANAQAAFNADANGAGGYSTGSGAADSVINPASAPPIQPVGSAEGGGTLMSDGSTVKADGTVLAGDGTTISTDGKVTSVDGKPMAGTAALGYVQMAAGLYSAYRAYKSDDLSDQQKGAQYAQSAVQVYNGYQAATGGEGLGWYGAVISGALGAYGAFTNDNMTSEQQATRAQQEAAKAVADLYTFGGASVFEGYARDKWGGTMRKFDRLDQKTNPATMALAAVGSSKTADQMQRDRVRDFLKDKGFVSDTDYRLKFSDGGEGFDIGKDGSATWTGIGGKKLTSYQTDYDNPLAKVGSGWGNMFGALLTGTTGRAMADTSGMLTNSFAAGAKEGEDVRLRGAEFAQKLGWTPESMRQRLAQMREGGEIDDNSFNLYNHDVGALFNEDNLTRQQRNQEFLRINNELETPEAHKQLESLAPSNQAKIDQIKSYLAGKPAPPPPRRSM